jgi:hypothetical protein
MIEPIKPKTTPPSSLSSSGPDTRGDEDAAAPPDRPVLVKGVLLHLAPDAAAAAYARHNLHSAVGADIAFVLASLLTQLSHLTAAAAGRAHRLVDPATAAPAALCLLLLAAQILRPGAYAARRRLALVLIVGATLAGDVAWLRSVAAWAGAAGDLSAAAGADSPWWQLANILLIRSGVAVLVLHSAMLALDFPWRAALGAAELALCLAHTALPLARLLARPEHLAPLRRLHGAARRGAVAAVGMLAAVPWPTGYGVAGPPPPAAPLPPLPTGGGSAEEAAFAAAGLSLDPFASPPSCLPLSAVVTAQVGVGLVLPLWVAFLRERRRRCAYALALCQRAAHHRAAAAAAAAAAAHPEPAAPPALLCACGDPACPAGVVLPTFTVRHFPAPLIRLLFAAAHGVCFLMALCAVHAAADVAASLAAPAQWHAWGVCSGPAALLPAT